MGRKGAILLALLLTLTRCMSQDSIWLARTTGKLPFMEYGIGDDRLGGAKMGYLDSNIIVRIIDSFTTDYKIRLSSLHSAYIAKTSVILLNKQINHPIIHNPHLSGRMMVYGDSVNDYVTIMLDGRWPYHSFQEINPSRVAVDIYGVTANTNWITQLSSAKEIKNTWYEQIEDDVLRVYIELDHQQHWGHSLSYDSAGNKLIVRIKRPPSMLNIRNCRIAIDAGHGGSNIGASGLNSKLLEKDFTLEYAKQLQKTFQDAGVSQIYMTREKDTTLSMPERIVMLKEFDPTLLISIHFNSADIDSIQGTSTYYRYIGFRPLSQSVLQEMLTLGLAEYGNVGNFNFSLSGPTDYPNVLVEVAFLSNPADEKRILNPEFKKAVALKIYAGVIDWLKQQNP